MTIESWHFNVGVGLLSSRLSIIMHFPMVRDVNGQRGERYKGSRRKHNVETRHKNMDGTPAHSRRVKITQHVCTVRTYSYVQCRCAPAARAPSFSAWYASTAQLYNLRSRDITCLERARGRRLKVNRRRRRRRRRQNTAETKDTTPQSFSTSPTFPLKPGQQTSLAMPLSGIGSSSTRQIGTILHSTRLTVQRPNRHPPPASAPYKTILTRKQTRTQGNRLAGPPSR